MNDRNVVDAMHRLELIRRMRIQTMLRGTDAHRGQGRYLITLKRTRAARRRKRRNRWGLARPA